MDLHIHAPIFFTQNNGTILSLDEALKFPIKTISAGQNNSFIGATKLAKLADAIVVDIGGTSTDCGVVINGFPIKSLGISRIAGVLLSFSAPNVISISLGGGSLITVDSVWQIQIGPKSVEYNLYSRSLSFGGDIMTLADSVIKKNCALELIVPIVMISV